MQRLTILLVSLLISPSMTYAASVANISNAICSGVFSFSLQDNASFLCDGDLTLSNGTITSDEKVFISSDGSLFIDNLQITASTIEIYSLQGLTLGSSVSFYNNFPGSSTTPSITVPVGSNLTIGLGNAIDIISGGNVNITLDWGNQALIGGQVALIDGGTITLTPVPLPTSSALMFSGILLCLVLKTGRKKFLENAIA